MKKIILLLSGFVGVVLMSGCSGEKDQQQLTDPVTTPVVSDIKTVRVDTLKVNDYILYNVTLDTLVGDFKVSVQNESIEGKYIHQDFFLNDSSLVQNYYPEMRSTIRVELDNELLFEKSYVKSDLPKGSFYELRENAVIKDFRFEAMIANGRNMEVIFIGTLYIPNTGIENDFLLSVTEDKKSKLSWINYEGE